MKLSLFAISYLYISTATRFYVNPLAITSQDGFEWDTPLNTLEAALSSAMSPTDEIWLMNGTYIPSNPLDRTDCFRSNPRVTIYGGFIGTESNVNERLISTEPSIISGDIGELGNNNDNCYHVITYTQSLTLNNVIIENGNANYNGNYETQTDALYRYSGAIMYSSNNEIELASLTLNNVVIRNNSALNGGAIFVQGKRKSVTINNSKFEFNRAIKGEYEGGYGGAIYAMKRANVAIFDTEFNYNFADFRGGAIYQDYGATLEANTCVFNQNKVNGFGGAIFSEDRNSQTEGTFPILISSIFSDNEAMINGGAIFWYNGVIGNLTDNQFTSNIAGNLGGAIALVHSQSGSNGNTFFDNIAIGDESGNTNNEYNEAAYQYSGIDSILSFDITTELETLYENIPSDTDVYPFDPNNNLCYVAGDNMNNMKDGSSWDKAYDNIQQCLDQLNTLSEGEIWVKTGTYTPTTIPEWKQKIGKTSDLMKSFSMYDNIKMYGGFDGTEDSRYNRNWVDNPTYLSCQLSSNRQCKQILNAADNTVVDGFIFTNAGGSGNRRRLANSISVEQVLSSTATSPGSGIYSNSTNIKVVNSIFHKLFTVGKGGAVYCIGMEGLSGTIVKSPTFINVAFLGNRAAGRGGAISADAECEFVCKSCKFEKNTCSGKGGAVYLDFDCDPLFEDTTFIDNYAMESGGCIAEDGHSFTTFTRNANFISNHADMEGGCLYSGSGVAFGIEQGFKFEQTPAFSDNYMSNNNIGHNDVYGWPYSTFIYENNEISITTTTNVIPSIDTTCISISDEFIYREHNVNSQPDTDTLDGYMSTAKTSFINDNHECVTNVNTMDFAYSAQWVRPKSIFKISMIVCCGDDKFFSDVPNGYTRYNSAMNIIYAIDNSSKINIKAIVVWCIVSLLIIVICAGIIIWYIKRKKKIIKTNLDPDKENETNIALQISETHNGEVENQ